jgi:transcriptional regulator with XRE-family HTH domain
MGTKRAGPVDAMVGRRIRARRLAKGVTQMELAKQLGVSFQQIQKYENGMNRIGAGRLVQIAQALGVPLDALFLGLDGVSRKTAQGDDPLALLSNGHAMRLAQAFSKILDKRIRLALVTLAEEIASERRQAG